MRGFDGGLANFLDVHRVPEGGETVAVVDFKNFGHPLPHAHEQNAFGTRTGENGRAALELIANVFAAVADRLEPTIWFLRHGQDSFQQRSISSSEMLRVPSRVKSLIVAKRRRSGWTPPVAASNSAAVIRSRVARVIASSTDISAGRGLPQRSK